MKKSRLAYASIYAGIAQGNYINILLVEGLLVGASIYAGILRPERVVGYGTLLGATEIAGGRGSGVWGTGLTRLLLGAVELRLEVENGPGTDPLDGLVFLRHHRRFREPPQRLHPPLPLLRLGLRLWGARGGRCGRCR
jgi:hypothetical protein